MKEMPQPEQLGRMAMNEVTKIELPPVPQSVEIAPQWIENRNTILAQSACIIGVQNQDDYSNAEAMRKIIKTSATELEKFRKQLSKPFSDAASRIKEIADNANEPLTKELARLNNLLIAYDTEIKRKQEAEAKAQLEAKSDSPFASFIPSTLAPQTESIKKTASCIVERWTFEILDEVQVPREFCSPDEKKIRAYAVAYKEAGNIPGVKIFKQSTVRSR